MPFHSPKRRRPKSHSSKRTSQLYPRSVRNLGLVSHLTKTAQKNMHQLIKYISQIAGVLVPDEEAMSRVCLCSMLVYLKYPADRTDSGITYES